MKTWLAALVLVIGTVGVTPALAAGCIKGAVVGGVAGHYAGHGVLGAAAGCLVGRHEAKKRERQRMEHDNGANPAPADAPRI